MKKVTTFLLALSFLSCLVAQDENPFERFVFEPALFYDEAIPSPESALGYELGARFTEYARVVRYFEQLAEASDRVRLNQYGETYEGRPLINLVITSAEHQARLEEVRKEHLRMHSADLSSAEAERLISELPVVTSMSYNIHGNEASSTEAAMRVAYRLAAALDDETREVLDNSIIVLYVCINPDGRDRYVYWYNGMQRQVPAVEPRDLEHYAPWPNGRTNHYWFDLNRDWVWGVHPESRGQVETYRKWMPQVHVDYHEQGYNNNYFTVPGTTPRNLLLPDDYEPLADTFGRANIAEFDKYQINYFTRQNFDFFYPGYGSSYPSIMGAVAMLTEQGGIGAGLGIETNDGYVLTLRQRIFDHYTTSIATIRKAAEHKEMFRRYSYEAWRPENSKSPVRGYFFPPQENPYLGDVIDILLRHGVEVVQTTGEVSLGAARNFRTGENERKTLPEGTYFVATDQPSHLFINSILERNMAIEDSVMYDMATWSAPLAYNLEAYSTEENIAVDGTPVAEAPALAGGLRNAGARYAYVLNWNQRHAPRALSMLWEKGYRVRAAREPFGNGEDDYPAGSLIILNGHNRDKQATIASDMQSVARETGVVIDGLDSGRMLEGMDLASSDNRPLKQPRVALLVEPPFSTYTAGQIYFLFDWETRLPVERIRASILQQTALPKFGSRYGYADLNDYDVLILPGGGSGLKEMFGKEQIEELKQWVSAGGVIVATESAVSFFMSGASDFTKVKMANAPRDTSEQAKYLPYAERRDYYGKKRIPGSALNGQVDITHPLAFGLQPELYSLNFSTQALEPDPGLQTVGFYDKDAESLLAAGYASRENLEHLSGKAFAGVVEIGAGKVVFLLDNTQYRMFWRGPSRMMQNAVMILPGF